MKKMDVVLLVAILYAVLSCGPLIHRETLVYGFVTDEDGRPVDSIGIGMVGGLNFATSAVIAEAQSDELGFYEINVDVSHKFSNANVWVDVNMNPSKIRFRRVDREGVSGLVREQGMISN